MESSFELRAAGRLAVVVVFLLAGSLFPAEDEGILVYRLATAVRTTAVEGGGYFPVVCKLRDGSIAAVVRGGGAHVDVRGRLDLVVSNDGGRTWSNPRVVVDSPDDDRNPAFGELADGTFVLAYSKLHGYDEKGKTLRRGKTYCEGIYVIRSRDQGKTWDEPTKIDVSPARSFSPYGKILQLSDGTTLMHFYARANLAGQQNIRGATESMSSYVLASQDGGHTWGKPVLIAPSFNETALADLRDGRLVAALRSDSGQYVAISFSPDKGGTWTEPHRVTEDDEYPADLLVLADGRLLLTYGERNRPYGARALVSHDGGATWERDKGFILAWDARNRDCGYPSSVQLEDGRILTVYYQMDDLEKAPQSAKARAVIWRVER